MVYSVELFILSKYARIPIYIKIRTIILFLTQPQKFSDFRQFKKKSVLKWPYFGNNKWYSETQLLILKEIGRLYHPMGVCLRPRPTLGFWVEKG